MHNFTKVVFIFLLFYIATTSGSLDLSGTWKNTSWNVLELHTSYSQRQISENIFAGENNHIVAFATRDKFSRKYPTSYNLTVITHILSGQTFANICTLNPSPKKKRIATHRLHRILILKENRILVTWNKQSATRGKTSVSQVIFVDTCQQSNFIRSGRDLSPWVFRYKNHFDMVVHDTEFCSDNDYCKLSYNYDGKLLFGKATEFPIFTEKEEHRFLISNAYAMNYNSGEGTVLITNRNGLKSPDNDYIKLTEDVYTPITGWIKAPKLFSRFSYYSNSSGFATLCWRINYWEELYCQRLDERGGKNASKFDMNLQSATILKIYNRPNGQILLLSHESRNLIIDEAHENGKCKRLESIANIDLIDKIKISIINENQYCLSVITRVVTSIDYYERPRAKYEFITKCARIPDLSHQKYIPCGNN